MTVSILGRLLLISFVTSCVTLPTDSYGCARCDPVMDGMWCGDGYPSGGQQCYRDAEICFTMGECGSSGQPIVPPFFPPWPPWDPDFSPFAATDDGLESAACAAAECGSRSNIWYVGFAPEHLALVSEHSPLLGAVLTVLRSPLDGGLPVTTFPDGLILLRNPDTDERVKIRFSGQISLSADFEVPDILVHFEFSGHPEIKSILGVFSFTERAQLVGLIDTDVLSGGGRSSIRF